MGYSLNTHDQFARRLQRTNLQDVFEAMKKNAPFTIEKDFVAKCVKHNIAFDAQLGHVDMIKGGKVIFSGSFEECNEWLDSLIVLRGQFAIQSKRTLHYATVWSLVGIICWAVAIRSEETLTQWVMYPAAVLFSLTMLANMTWYFSLKSKLFLDSK